MSLKDSITKEIGPALSKAVMAALFNSLTRPHSSEGASSSADYSSAWKEIEHKLQGLFTTEQEKPAGRNSYGMAVLTAGAVGLVALVYLYGRQRGRRQSSILEVHKA